MMRRIGFAVLVAGMVIGVQPSFAADATMPESSKPKTEAKKLQTQLVTEGEFAHWLVQVLGLSRFLPAAPSDQECFAVLLQNSIKPKDGWNATNTVTRGTLARVTVQAMGKAGEVKDSSKDESYIEFLRAMGIEIGTIGEAVETLEALEAPLANEAISVRTDPLSKVHRIRPVDEQQLGADMSTITRVFTEAVVPPGPPPMTPN
ncbi:MAG: hypothetical protein V1929_09250 [bacterium]